MPALEFHESRIPGLTAFGTSEAPSPVNSSRRLLNTVFSKFLDADDTHQGPLHPKLLIGLKRLFLSPLTAYAPGASHWKGGCPCLRTDMHCHVGWESLGLGPPLASTVPVPVSSAGYWSLLLAAFPFQEQRPPSPPEDRGFSRAADAQVSYFAFIPRYLCVCLIILCLVITMSNRSCSSGVRSKHFLSHSVPFVAERGCPGSPESQASHSPGPRQSTAPYPHPKLGLGSEGKGQQRFLN